MGCLTALLNFEAAVVTGYTSGLPYVSLGTLGRHLDRAPTSLSPLSPTPSLASFPHTPYVCWQMTTAWVMPVTVWRSVQVLSGLPACALPTHCDTS